MDKIIYFELNNWIPGIFYPDDEPFRLWMKNDLQIKFDDETWVKKSRLCVVRELIDIKDNIHDAKELVELMYSVIEDCEFMPVADLNDKKIAIKERAKEIFDVKI